MKTIKIDKNIPIPIKNRRGRKAIYPFSRMKVGDSIFSTEKWNKTMENEIKLLTGFWELALSKTLTPNDEFAKYIGFRGISQSWHLLGCLINDGADFSTGQCVMVCYYDVKLRWKYYYYIGGVKNYFTCIKYVDIRNEYMFPDNPNTLKTIYESFTCNNGHFNDINLKIDKIIF